MLNEKKVEIYEDALFNTDRSSIMLVCINGYSSGLPYGEIVNCHLIKSISFEGIDDLVMAIDEVCDLIGAPPRTTEPRFLCHSNVEQYKKPSQTKNKMSMPEKRKAAEWMVPYMIKAKAVMVVEVIYRQNSSMQGRLLCHYEGSRYVTFRSALELMRMLNEAVKGGTENKDRSLKA